MTPPPTCLVCSRPARRPNSRHPLCNACRVAIQRYEDHTRAQLLAISAELTVQARCIYAARFGIEQLGTLACPPLDSGAV